MQSTLGIKIENKGAVTLILIEGYFNPSMVTEINEKLYDILKSDCKSIVVDLHQLNYISSAGLRILLYVATEMENKGGKMALCAVSTGVQRVLKMCGADNFFSTYPTQDDAVKSVS